MTGSRELLRIEGGTVLTPSGWTTKGLTVADGLVLADGDPAQAKTANILNASGLRVVPGFVDLQVNGGWGIDFASDPSRIWEVGSRLAETGVTSWLPTLVTSAPNNLPRALAALKNRPADWTGAEPLGWHLEGPWLNPVRKGAHRQEFLASPTLPLDPTLTRANGVVLVTLAPEMPGCAEAIVELVDRGVVVSLGHSDADAAPAARALASGATMGTHLFNAMSGLHHREPGLAAALLVSNAYLGLIADGIHVVPDMVNLAWKAARDRVVLVTDTMAGLGLPAGTVTLGRYEVHLDGVSARLADGTLAGSVLDMPTAIRNLMAFTGCSLADALRSATLTPMRALGGQASGGQSSGVVDAGSPADLVIIDDDVQVLATIVNGRVVYRDDRLVQERVLPGP